MTRMRGSSAPPRRCRGATMVVVGLALATSCRCHNETLSPVDMGDETGDGAIDGRELLAPPWGRPSLSTLDNGLIVHWLHEAGAPGFHLRLLLPTTGRADRLDAASVAVAVRATQQELDRRLAHLDAAVEVDDGPGRVEIAIHGRGRQTAAILAIVGDVMGHGRPLRRLSTAQGKLRSETRTPSPADAATGHVVTRLLSQPRETEIVAADRVAALTKTKLERAWWTLTDPRDLVAIVHAGVDASAQQVALAELAQTWRGHALLKRTRHDALSRIRHPAAKSPNVPTGPLLGETPVALAVVADSTASPEATLVIGRTLPAATPEERAMARLVQRMLQEELDVRLLMSGEIALLLVRVRLSPSNPVRSLRNALEQLEAFADAEDLPARARQAAQLWLGARVVGVSLEGEDWTSLWSESIDLAKSDADIHLALARDARSLLAADPAAIRAWRREWLHPRRGRPGWIWAVAGAHGGHLVELAKVVPLTGP